jgi:hypothetical protein
MANISGDKMSLYIADQKGGNFIPLLTGLFLQPLALKILPIPSIHAEPAVLVACSAD